MLTKQEEFDVALEVIQRLAPEILEKYQAGDHSYPTHSAAPIQTSREVPANRRNSPNLRQILRRIGPLPPFSALIGQCFDGLPFLFDLSDPSPGSILISGAPYSGKTRILRTILASAACLNPPSQINFYVLSPNIGEFDSIAGYSHCKGMISSYDRASTSQVIRLAEIAEQRKSGRNRGAVIILAIDNLEAMLEYKEHELKSYLRWLVKYGPRLDIWPVVTVNPVKVHERDDDLIAEFGTHLGDGSQPRQLDSGISSRYPALPGRGQFVASVGGESFRFSALDAV
jgi:hypothetical protein